MEEKEYEVTTHYKIGCDTVEIHDSVEMMDCIEALQYVLLLCIRIFS
jgi:hypothetical protein